MAESQTLRIRTFVAMATTAARGKLCLDNVPVWGWEKMRTCLAAPQKVTAAKALLPPPFLLFDAF